MGVSREVWRAGVGVVGGACWREEKGLGRENEGAGCGAKMRLRGKGIVSMKVQSVHGEQEVTVQIEVPRYLDPAAKQKLKEFEAACAGKARTA